MSTTINYPRLVNMFRAAIEQIRANNELLSKLDSVGGDGDHGTTMLRAMTTIEKTIAECGSGKMNDLLESMSWAVMGVDGGATGPLFGTFFGGMAPATEGKTDLDGRAVAAMLEGGLSALAATSKAKVGDKTMMDTLVPAIAAARKAAEGGADALAVLSAAAEAAAIGAESTSKLQARFGRARNIGAASIGSPDAGATSASLIFKGFAEGATNG